MPPVLNFLLLKQVAEFESTGQEKMAHGNYHWLLFTIYLYTPHGQRQYTLRKKKTLYERRERNNAFRISAGLLRAVVLLGLGTYWVKWSGFLFSVKKKSTEIK